MGTAQLLTVMGLRWLPGCPASVPSNLRWWAESFSPSSVSDPFQRAEETVLLVCWGPCHRSDPLDHLGHSPNLRFLVLVTYPGSLGPERGHIHRSRDWDMEWACQWTGGP